MKIKNVEITSNIFLAPMAGVTDIGFRKICRDFGAGLTYTEMISVKGLYYNNKKTEMMLQLAENEKPSCVQLFGSDPEIFSKVIKSGVLDKFDIIDINMGCPAPKIVNNGDGSKLLCNINKAREIISACVSSTDKPITVKFRMGYNNGENIAVEFAKMCQEAGAAAITIHPRTREQFYSGQADLSVIKDVKKAVSIPVIGNGDIVDEKSYKAMLETGCDAVMIGRGALGNPELFAQLLGKEVSKAKLDVIKEHLALIKPIYSSEKALVTAFRKHLLWYVSNYHLSTHIKVELMKYETIDEILKVLEDFFNNLKV